MNISIIGAGISGLSLAIKCQKKNINYTIYEMNPYVGGIWNKKSGIVNKYSNIQVISPTFKFEDDDSDYTEYTESEEIFEKIINNYEKYDIFDKIKFETKLLNFISIENNKVELILQNINTKEIFKVITDALYIRTGTLNKVRELILPNENKFEGIISYGTNDKKDDIDFNNKVVTIIGFGATAVENINNAFKKGAKKVVVLARSLRNIWSRRMLYQIVNELIYPQHYLSDYFRKKSWGRVNEIYTKTMKHFNNDTINKIVDTSTYIIDNELNHNMSKIPAVTEDILIYCYYGLLDIYCDEIIDINDNQISTKNGTKYETDIIFKCTGYELEDTFISSHKIDNTIFIDGKYNITHNCGLDRSSGIPFILGPSKDVNPIPLISYPMINHIFDELALYFLEFPYRFEVFNKNKIYDEIISNTTIKYIELKSYIYMFWKLVEYLKFSPLDLRLTFRIGIHLWNLRQDMFNSIDKNKFNELDKKLWNKTSKFCFDKTKNIEYLQYPH